MKTHILKAQFIDDADQTAVMAVTEIAGCDRVTVTIVPVHGEIETYETNRKGARGAWRLMAQGGFECFGTFAGNYDACADRVSHAFV